MQNSVFVHTQNIIHVQVPFVQRIPLREFFSKSLIFAFLVCLTLWVKPVSELIPWFVWIPIFFWGSFFPEVVIFFICATQFVTISSNSPFTLGQLALVVFLSTFFIFSKKLLNMKNMSTCVYIAFPYWLWSIFACIFNGGSQAAYDAASSFVTVLITVSACNRSNKINLLGSLLLSFFLVSVPFWFKYFSIDFLSSEVLTANEAFRGGVQRFAAGNGDFNFAGIGIAMGIAFAFSIATFSKKNSFMYFMFLSIGTICIPSLLATLSRGAILSLLLASIVICCFVIFNNKKISIRIFSERIIISLVMFFILYYLVNFFSKDYIYALHSFIFDVGVSDTAGREVNFAYAFSLIDSAPFIGVGDVPGFFAHNTFLTEGVRSGIVSTFLFFTITIFPFIRIMRSVNDILVRSIGFGYTICIFSFQSLSISGFKVFWVLWTILLIAESLGRSKMTDFSVVK